MQRSLKRFLFPLAILISCTFFLFSCKSHGPVLDPAEGLTAITCSGIDLDSTIYYVSGTGSDESDGRTENTAFRTLGKGMEAVKPGGTVRILPGTYHEGLALEQCGSEQAPITLEGYGGRPVLDGKGQWTIGLYCEGCTNFRIEHLEFKNFTDAGILISGSNEVVLHDLRLKENGHKSQLKAMQIAGYGLAVKYSENIEISECEVFRNGPKPQVYPDNLLGTGIYTLDNRHVHIRKNQCFKNIGGGIQVRNSFDVEVAENEVYENDLEATVVDKWDGGLWLDGGGEVTIRNNYFHDNLGPGIQVSDENDQQPTGFKLEFNNSTNNFYGIYIRNFGSLQWPDSSILTDTENNWTGNEREDIWIQR